MTYLTYRLLHLSGIVTLIGAGAAWSVRSRGPEGQTVSPLLSTLLVLALFAIPVGGFGMLARMGAFESGMPSWASLKLGIWAVATLLVASAARIPRLRRSLVALLPLLALGAALVAILKPFR